MLSVVFVTLKMTLARDLCSLQEEQDRHQRERKR